MDISNTICDYFDFKIYLIIYGNRRINFLAGFSSFTENFTEKAREA